jgi:hypothetical protein
MEEPTRRAWSRPGLIVIVRGTPEETVLTPCKVGSIYAVSANDRWGGCYAEPYDIPCPNVCSAMASS